MKITNEKQHGFAVIELLIILVVVGVVGFSVWRIANRRQADNDTNTVAHAEVLPDDLSGLKSIDEIISLAAAEIGTRQLLAAELELEDQVLVYSIKLSDGTALIFDALTGAKIQLNNPDSLETDDDEPLPAGFTPTITIQTAVQTAKDKRPGKTISKVELEVEDGIVVFSIRFTNEGRVDIDALTGEILRLREPGQPDVKLRDDDDDIDDDGDDNGIDADDDNDGSDDDEDSDDEGDGLDDDEDDDDDNDGADDDEDDDSDNSGSGSGGN